MVAKFACCIVLMQSCCYSAAEGEAHSHWQCREDSWAVSAKAVGNCLQVEGAFIQGLGLFTSEEVITDSDTGRLITDGTWEYKIPAATCIPRQFNATFLKVTHASCAESLPILGCAVGPSAAYVV